MVNNSTNINKTINYLYTKKKSTTYDIGNPDLGFGQAQKCDGIKPANVNPENYSTG